MFYRKGVDLLVDIIPEITRKYPNVYFIIGGDGPKKPLLDQLMKNTIFKIEWNYLEQFLTKKLMKCFVEVIYS